MFKTSDTLPHPHPAPNLPCPKPPRTRENPGISTSGMLNSAAHRPNSCERAWRALLGAEGDPRSKGRQDVVAGDREVGQQSSKCGRLHQE